jgi:ABC-type antimicrobial peptide transport system permease subunit
MKFAVFGDIHGNIDALKSAYDAALKADVGKIYHLGDLGGYSPFVIKLISASGMIMFLVLGTALLVAFCLLIMFNLKTREKEISVLRMLGWKISDLKRQFIGEMLVLLAISLVAGNLMALAGLGFLRTRTISMELPWDISAKPHFLPQENSIERIITAQIPIHIDWLSFVLLSAAFLGIFLAINYALFYRLRNIKPQEIQGR